MLLVDGSSIRSMFRPWHPPLPWIRRLLGDVARLTRDWESCADVVFEGLPRCGLADGCIVDAVGVWFAAPESAATFITRRLTADCDGPSVVVTSDAALAARVQRLGAAGVPGEALRHAIDRVCGAAHSGRTVRGPPGELAGLLALHDALRAVR